MSCHVCGSFKGPHYNYPEVTCISCCSKVPVRRLLELMDITYHSAIQIMEEYPITRIRTDDDYLFNSVALFWCTMDPSGLYQRCGVCRTWGFKPNPNFNETRIIVVKPYWSENERGYHDMQQLKQNLKRVICWIPYHRY